MSSIVFCTTCKGRVQHIEQTLPPNLSGNQHSKFVILNYNSPDHLNEYLFSQHREAIESGRVVVYTMPPGKNGPIPFAMAHAKNMAHRCGILEGGDILVNLDADNYAGEGFDQYIQEEFRQGDKTFLQAMWNRWVVRNGCKEWLAEDPEGVLGPPVPKGSNGRMVVSRDAFLLAGGYNEKYSTWGPDDKDFNIRLRRLGFRPRLLSRKHQDTILHNDRVRFKDYPHAVDNKEEEFVIGVNTSNETVVNFGKIGCGLVYRNSNFDTPIELQPLPTRIFGIGMHKTATTSLDRALKTLGYDSAHWKTAHWAKAIWQEMTTQEKSLTLEQSYALSDLPITMLYKELDLAYPGSKFILTIRGETSWLESIKNHWDSTKNPFRECWDHDPFTHFVHKQLYGRRDFDPEVFLDRYRRHNSEVLEYFKGRSNDLLVLWDHNWPQLCQFLGRPIPHVQYPRLMVTEK